MKRKRLSREGWNFSSLAYWQFRIDADEVDFHGIVGFLYLKKAREQAWDFPRAGKAPVAGDNMVWLELIPDGASHVITAMLARETCRIGGVSYPYTMKEWYVDIVDRIEYDPDGVAAFMDCYLDVIFTPQGDLVIDDRDELDAAYQSGELSDTQYKAALDEADIVLRSLCKDIHETEAQHLHLFSLAEKRIQMLSPMIEQ